MLTESDYSGCSQRGYLGISWLGECDYESSSGPTITYANQTTSGLFTSAEQGEVFAVFVMTDWSVGIEREKLNTGAIIVEEPQMNSLNLVLQTFFWDHCAKKPGPTPPQCSSNSRQQL